MVRTRSALQRLGDAALDLLYPPRCVVCHRSGLFLCAGCAGAMTEASSPRCSRCWQPNKGAELCRDCRSTPPAYDGTRSAFVYAGPARTLVHALKYRQTTALASPMAAFMAELARQHELQVDVVMPVPLSGRRERTRGYNQAAVLGHALALELDLPLSKALVRRRHTPPQARSADAESRRRNVSGAFACRGQEMARRRVLLVDDVTTTGATLDSCAGALKEAGAAAVWALTFARED